jgi:tetratricopeptide (TPR) repeat protein
MPRLVVLSAAFCLFLSSGLSTASLSVTDLLDRYASGKFDAVVEELAGDVDFNELLKQLRRDGPKWIAAADPAARARRELVAATFALEAARAGQWIEWKLIQKPPKMCPGAECQPPNILYWKAPPLLIEWGCELFRRDATPRPIERWWQLAALAVAQRSEDPQFLVGDLKIGRGFEIGEIGNREDEIKHLDHVTPRFPKEMRFVLAQGIARDRDDTANALNVYRALDGDPDVGGEAVMRLGAMQVKRRGLTTVRFPGDDKRTDSPSDALKHLERAETLTRDAYVVFLARYFKAQIFERQRRVDQAEAAYRGAVSAIPHAQSATVALAALIVRDGRRSEAHRLVRDMFAANPAPADPWRGYIHADDRFWPQLIARLRLEIQR